MKAILITLLSLTFLHLCSAQNLYNLIEANKVTAYTYWDIGDSKVYKCTKKETVFKNGKEKPKKAKQEEYKIRLKVLDTLNGLYTMSLTYFDYLETMNLTNDVKINDLEIKYSIDEFGAFDSILNTIELKTFVEEYFKKMIDEDNLIVDSNFVNQLLDKDYIHTLFINDIITFHNLYGFQFQLGKKEEFEFIYATLNDFDLKGIGEIELKSINKEKKESVITVIQTPDKDELKEYINILFKMLVSSGEEKEGGFENFGFKSKVKQTYYMDLENGTMNKIKTKKTVKVKGGKGFNEKRYEMIYGLL